MIGLEVKTVDQTKRVSDAVDRGTFRNLGHAAARVSKDAKASIQVAEGPSAPGSPPHTRRRHLPRAIRYDVDRAAQDAVIGPMASIVGEAGAAHELGATFKGTDFDERAFMGPALEKNADRFADDWVGSIGE
jgi:hypothetical protein